ncbi:MAG: ferredoxin family protein [Deltaproteobacteria bacterium]|jgi:adenylylsulfate reductase subunit B|nr:ferredoxin family protein [Deltaproteobacteria bacterium]MCK9502547.1 ferredoxin family protein [Lascolabacillus sp.]
MPPRINPDKCNGCEGLAESKCEEACPGDLMAVDETVMKAYCRSTNDCWDCMSCTKACPRNAIEQRIPYQLGYHKATLKPFMSKNTITWKCKDIYGNEKVYKYRNRMDK